MQRWGVGGSEPGSQPDPQPVYALTHWPVATDVKITGSSVMKRDDWVDLEKQNLSKRTRHYSTSYFRKALRVQPRQKRSTKTGSGTNDMRGDDGRGRNNGIITTHSNAGQKQNSEPLLK